MTDRVVTVTLRGDWSDLRTANSQAVSSVRSTAAQMNGVTARSSTAFGNAGMTAGRRFTSGLTSAARGFIGLSALYGVGRFLADTVQLEAQFSKTMNVIQATTGASGHEMERLRGVAKKMGADTVFSANEASEAMLELARGGLSPAQIEAGALEQTLTLAAAGQLGLAEAANATVKTMGQFNLRAGEANRVAAALAGGANASSASVQDMGMALAQAGLAANSVGFSVEETTGILAAFSNAGLEGSDAGTSLKTMLDRLQPSSKSTADAMKELGIITEDGANQFLNANGTYKSAAEIAQVLKTATDDLTDSERKRLITAAFGSDAQRAATVLAKEGAAGIQEMVKATSDQNAAQDMANANMEGTAGALERLSGSWETLKLSIGEGIAPIVQEGADALANLLGMMAGDDAPSGLAGDIFDAWVDHAKRSFGALQDIWDGAVKGAQNLMDSIGRALEEHGGMFEAIFRNLSSFADGIYDILGPVLGWVAEHWLTGLGKEFELFADGLKLAGNVFFDFSDIALQAMSLIVENVSNGIDFILDKFQDLAEIGAALNLPGYDAIVDKIQEVRDGVNDFSDDFVANAERRRAALDREQYLWNLTGAQADMLKNRIKALPDEVRTLIKIPGALDSFNEVKRYQRQLGLTDDEVITILQAQGVDLAVSDIRRLKNEYHATPHEVVTIMKQSGGALTVREVRDLQKVYDLTPKQVSTLLRATDNATAIIKDVQTHGKDLDNDKYTPTIDGNGQPALSVIDSVRRQLAGLHDKTITISTHITTFHDEVYGGAGGYGGRATAGASGMTVPGPRHPYGDKVFAYLAPGEEVISNDRGQADRHRGLLKAINAGMAAGGTAGSDAMYTYARTRGPGSFTSTRQLDDAAAALADFTYVLSGATRSTKTWDTHLQMQRHLLDDEQKELRLLNKAYEDHRAAVQDEVADLKEMRQARSALSQSVASNFNGDPLFQPSPENGMTAWGALELSLKNQTAQANAFEEQLQAAQSHGLSGGLFEYISQHPDTGLAAEFATMTRAQIRAAEQLYQERNQAAHAVGNFAGDTIYARDIREQTHEIKGLRADSRDMRDSIKRQEEIIKRQEKVISRLERTGPERTGDEVGKAINKKVADTARRRQ